jgi:DNA mismatch repair protein MutS2
VNVEERRVLEERSRWIAEEGDELMKGLRRCVSLDLLQARAVLGARLDGAICQVDEGGALALVGARNPLLVLRGVAVVANDIVLDAEQSFLVVTGPNTGGKTVTLSTAGLLTVMLQAGIPIPVHEESRALLFRAVHAVVGDPQDIERDLSTFSGHLALLQGVLDVADVGHLVLLDEIIVGTDPSQGAALAISVLESLASRGARGLATTHYPRVKALALEDERFANASVGVHAATGVPSYQLSLGTPGDSSPLRIAEQLGFDSDVLQRAHALASGGQDMSVAIQRLESARAEVELELAEAAAARESLALEAQRLTAERAKLVERADSEVAKLHEVVRREAEEALKVIREQVRAAQRSSDPKVLRASRRAVIAAKSGVDAATPTPVEAGPPALPAPPSVGDQVWVRTLSATGGVVELRSDGRVVVAAGGLKLTVGFEQLAQPPKAPKGQRKPTRPASRPVAVPTSADDDLVGPPQTTNVTLDLRGARRDEVEDALVPFLDRLYANNDDAGWIIHGHGTGAIRDEVRSLLKCSPYVRDSRPGRRGEGGDGITLVWLRRD